MHYIPPIHSLYVHHRLNICSPRVDFVIWHDQVFFMVNTYSHCIVTIPYISTVAQYMFTVCSPFIHHVVNAYLLHSHSDIHPKLLTHRIYFSQNYLQLVIPLRTESQLGGQSSFITAFTIYSLYVHYILPIRSLYVHHWLTICSPFVDFVIWHDQVFFMVNTYIYIYSHCIVTTKSLYVHYIYLLFLA